MKTYSKLGFSDQVQIESLHCLSSDWRSTVLKGIVSGEKLLGRIKEGSFVMANPNIAEIFDYIPSGALDVVSEELGNFLAKRMNIELLPIVVSPKGGSRVERKYFVLHILDTFDAMDRSESKYEEYPEAAGGGISTVSKLVIDREVANESAGFILNELGIVVFENEICREVMNAGFRGLKFTDIDQFQFG